MTPIKRTFKRPFYISDSFEMNVKWSAKFTTALDTLGEKYGVPKELIDKVKANNLVIQCVGSYETLLLDTLGKWRVLKDSLMVPMPESVLPIDFPANPEFPEKPAAGGAYILEYHIRAAEIILSDKNLTENDRKALGLEVAEGKPLKPGSKPREKADQFNYPLIKATVKNGTITVRVIRGNIFRNATVLLMVDKQGNGLFTKVMATTAKEISSLVSLPTGQLAAVWTYKAIYIEGDTQLSDWSPLLYVPVHFEEPPPPSAASDGSAAGTGEGQSGASN